MLTNAEISYIKHYVAWVKLLGSADSLNLTPRQKVETMMARADRVWAEKLGVFAPPVFQSADSLLTQALMKMRRARIALTFEAERDAATTLQEATKLLQMSSDELIKAGTELDNDPTRRRNVPENDPDVDINIPPPVSVN